MILTVIDASSGAEVLCEHGWQGEIPRKGDVMELHCGGTKRWRVDEVDWVFEDSAPENHDDIPLKSLVVKASPYDAATGGTADPVCQCGHRQSIHSPNGCTGRSHTCECAGFAAKA